MPTPKSNHPPLRLLGSTGLRCHPLGFGCYRVVEGNAMHEAALRQYLEKGGNLIDTSANYGDGRSEQLVGKVLQGFPRDQVILVTKGGYIQGQNLALALERKFPEVVEYGEGLCHSIHPEFLETQIAQSMERLRQPVLDVYLLHNPEYYLEHEAHQNQLNEKHRKEFYRRVQEAFRFLEGKVAEGKVRWYGISSNNFGMPASSPTLTSIARCWQAAESVAADHHFRVVQLPMNLYERGGAVEANNNGKTALEFCRERGIGVLINRPLNAFFQNRMVRLADFLRRGQKPPGKEELRALLEPARKMEEELEQQFEIPLFYGEQSGIANYLEVILPQVKSPAQWEQIFYPYIIQPIERWAVQCQQLLGGPAGVAGVGADIFWNLSSAHGRHGAFRFDIAAECLRRNSRATEAGRLFGQRQIAEPEDNERPAAPGRGFLRAERHAAAGICGRCDGYSGAKRRGFPLHPDRLPPHECSGARAARSIEAQTSFPQKISGKY